MIKGRLFMAVAIVMQVLSAGMGTTQAQAPGSGQIPAPDVAVLKTMDDLLLGVGGTVPGFAGAAVDKQAMLSLAVSGPDDAQGPLGTGQDKEATSDGGIDPRMAAQLPLADASSQIHQLWREKRLSNFSGVRLDNDRGTVVLYWKGPLPPEMAELVRNLRESTPIEVVDSPYSLSEFQQEAMRLVGLDPAAAGFNVTEAGPLRDFSGLRVAVETAEQLALARQVIQSPIRLELTVAPKSNPVYYRWDDDSPFWGGAAIDHSLGGGNYFYCTTGFAVTTSSGTEGLLTAAHCKYQWDYYTPEGDEYVGTVDEPMSCLNDAATLIGDSYSPYIYVGAWNSSQAKYVAGWEYPAVDQYVFVSGSWSGEHVVRVQSISQYVDATCEPWAAGPGFWTVDEEEDGSAGTGDSGGPVARYVSGGSSVKGLGIISQGDPSTQATCEGRTGSGRTCFWRVWHPNLGDILDDFNETLQ